MVWTQFNSVPVLGHEYSYSVARPFIKLGLQPSVDFYVTKLYCRPDYIRSTMSRTTSANQRLSASRHIPVPLHKSRNRHPIVSRHHRQKVPSQMLPPWRRE